MKETRIIFIFSALYLSLNAYSQHRIQGYITDEFHDPLIGANAYIQGTFSGATTDTTGFFSFTIDQDTGILVISYLGYETLFTSLSKIDSGKISQFSLQPAFTGTGVVTITAGAFEASDEKKGVILNSIDIATTAGATADIAAALNTLPGTQRVGETGQLFVRGGEAYETRTFMDGLRVQNPFNATVPDIPSRARFSPFLFKGTLFSTGGYSAEYGQALSSALILETEDLAEETLTGISLMSLGADLSHTHRWDKQSLGLSIGHTDLSPYFQLVPQRVEWEQSPTSTDFNLNYRHQLSAGGQIKAFAGYQGSNMRLNIPSRETAGTRTFYNNENDYFFFNSSFQEIIGEKWVITGGATYTLNQELQKFELGMLDTEQTSTQIKVVANRAIHERLTLKIGQTFIHEQFSETYTSDQIYHNDLQDIYIASFAESSWQISPKWAARIGFRWEHAEIIDDQALAPRLSVAYKTGKYSQISMAWGHFYQTPSYQLMRNTQRLSFENAQHLIINYQYQRDDRTLRIEGYFKNYTSLVRFQPTSLYEGINYDNRGKGYARGVDFFWRDKKSIDRFDYWISYSFLDTRRLFRDFPEESTPVFASKHNVSVVSKYFVNTLDTQLGFTYAFTSPRPFHNPNMEGFNQGRTPAFHDLSFNASYLTSIWGNFTIVYTSITNLLGSDQIFGYRFAHYEDANGTQPRFAIRPPARRFVFLGVFISIT